MQGKNNKEENTHEDTLVPPGMLSSPQIAYYVDKYEIITEYDKSCLEPASYNMRIGGEVLTWYEGDKVDFILGPNEDKNQNIRKSVDLQPNSLTFLTTIEKFQLPKDIIARFNLKSKWVHQGLLLGTGPIVDPQLHAHLLIPVHNFSSQIVTMNYGEEFISVEFTKTLDPGSQLLLKNKELSKYVENEHWDFNFQKYRERIANKKVESSVLNQFQKSNKQIELTRATIADAKKDIDKTIESVWKFNIISFVGVGVALFALALTSWQLIESTHEKADAAYNLVKEYKGSSVDFRAFALKSNYDDLQQEFQELKKYVKGLNTESYLTSDKSAADLKAMQNRFEEKMQSMALRIEELEKKLNQTR